MQDGGTKVASLLCGGFVAANEGYLNVNLRFHSSWIVGY